MATTPARRHTAWGKEIEPDFVLGPSRASQPVQGVPIHIEGLEKSFDGVPVLRGLDLDIPAGQFVAIVGKSGCGKSTLLRLVSGLDRPSAGLIRIGDNLREEAAISRIVFQEPRLLPWAKVIDNVAVGLGPAVPRAASRERALEALTDVQLADRANEWPARLSGGQRQRVALARALVSRPDFMALDEPLGALDALTRITMQGLVERVWREQGFTALFVTHDVAEAVALADRVIILDEGKIALDLDVKVGRPRGCGTVASAAIERQLLEAILQS